MTRCGNCLTRRTLREAATCYWLLRGRNIDCRRQIRAAAQSTCAVADGTEAGKESDQRLSAPFTSSFRKLIVSNCTRRLYLEELSRKTVLVGRWSTLIGVVVLAFFIFCDTVWVPVRGTLPWRFFGIACCLGFLSLAHAQLKRDSRLAIPLYAVTLAGVLLSVCGTACTMFYVPPHVPGTSTGRRPVSWPRS